MATIEFTEEAIIKYLDEAIVNWRRKMWEGSIEDRRIASCYVDAFQSIRMSLFGELLP